MLMGKSMVLSFLLLNNSSSYAQTIICLTIYLLVDILGITNKSTMNIQVCILVWTYLSLTWIDTVRGK